MKHLRLAGFIAGLLLLPQLANATAPRFSVEQLAEEAKPHLVAFEEPPLVGASGSEPGAAVEIVRRAFEAMGRPVELEVLPSRSLSIQLLSTDSKVVGMLGQARAMSAAERKPLLEEKLLTLSGNYYFYRPAHGELAQVTNLAALKGLSYGAIPGEPVESLTRAGIKVSVAEPRLQLRKLASREIDFMSAFSPNADWMIAQLFPNEKVNFATMRLAAWETPFSLWFNPAHPPAREWRKTFAEGLKKIRQNGVYSEIMKKYHLDGTLTP